MNLNRRKNIYTLGDIKNFQATQQQPRNITHHLPAQKIHTTHQRRQQNSDPFERDPFKIQSYNFHYADRPTYPLQNLVNRVSNRNNRSNEKQFETFYYNYDFTPSRTDKENTTAAASTSTAGNSKFHELRRRKFLQERQRNATTSNLFASSENNDHTAITTTINRGYSITPINRRNSKERQHVNQTPAAIYSAGTNNSTSGRTSASVRTNIDTSGGGGGGSGGGSGCGGNSATTDKSQAQEEQHQLYSVIRSVRRSGSNRSFSNISNRGTSPRPSEKRSEKYNFEIDVTDAIGGSGFVRHRENDGVGHSSATAVNKKSRDASVPRASSSQHQQQRQQQRRPLQTLHLSGGGTGGVEETNSTCSGCQININIKGLDNKQAGENVTINIETDLNGGSSSCHSSSNNREADASLPFLRNRNAKISSPNKMNDFNIMPRMGSSETIVIDRNLSKFYDCTDNRKGSKISMKAVPPIRTTTSGALNSISNTDMNMTSSSTPQRNETLRQKERRPSMVPWKIDDNLRSCFPNPMDPLFRPTNQMRRIRTNYNSAVKDTNNMRAYLAHKNSLSINTNYVSERKLINTVAAMQRKMAESMPKPPGSRHSLRSNYENSTNYGRIGVNATRSSTSQQNRQIRAKSPLNVNINVYADKLKLMRV